MKFITDLTSLVNMKEVTNLDKQVKKCIFHNNTSEGAE